MNGKSHKKKLKEIGIKSLILIIVFFVLSQCWLLSQKFKQSPNKKRLDAYKNELSKFNKNTRFLLDFDINGRFMLVAIDDTNSITILDYSDVRDEIDIVSRQTFGSKLKCIIGFDDTMFYDEKNNIVYTMKEDGSFIKNTYNALEDMSMLSLSANKDFITSHANIYENYFFYKDYYLYKMRPNFGQYLSDYNMGLLSDSSKIDLKNLQYLIFKKGPTGIYTDYTNIPYDNASLALYINDLYGAHLKKTNYKDVIAYSRLDIDYVPAEEMVKIINYLRGKDGLAIYDYIKAVKDKEYLGKDEKFTEAETEEK